MREYLERHLEPRSVETKPDQEKSSEGWIKRFPQSVQKDLAPDLELGESGTETVKLDSGTLTLSYEPLPEDVLKRYRRHNVSLSDLQGVVEPEQLEEIAATSMFMQMERGGFRRLNKLTIETKSGAHIELTGLPVENVLFSVVTELEKSRLSGKDVLLYGPPTSPLALMVLFHEIGHAEVLDKATVRERLAFLAAGTVVGFEKESHPTVHRKWREDLFEKNAEVILRHERDAWAVALSKLRHVFPALNVSRSDVLRSIHELILSSYSDVIRGRIARRPQQFQTIDSLVADTLDA
jgi:hypothetical protein